MSVIHHPNVVTDGLVAYWDAGNRVSYPGAGTVWTDLVSGRVGTFYNDTTSGAHGPDFFSGNMGYLEFDGTDAWVKGPVDGSDMNLNDHLTMSCWAWWDTSTQNGIWAKNKAGTMQYGMGRYAGSRYFYVGIFAGSWGDYPTATVLNNDQWYHLTATYDRAYVRLYIDGVFIREIAETDPISGDGTYFSMGGVAWSAATIPTEWLAGRLSTVQVYDCALTAAEVLQNYNATKGRFT